MYVCMHIHVCIDMFTDSRYAKDKFNNSLGFERHTYCIYRIKRLALKKIYKPVDN